MKPRIIICGLGRTGYQIFCLLKQQGASVVGINDVPLDEMQSEDYKTQFPCSQMWSDMEQGSELLIGNLRSPQTLISAGVKEAHTLVLAIGDDALNLAVLTQARVLNPHIRIINRLFNSSLGVRLDRVLPSHTSMSVAALSAPVFAFTAMGSKAIGQLQLFNQTWPIHEEYIDADHPWRNRPLNELWRNSSRMLIYYIPVRTHLDLVSAVLQQECLQEGDRLIVATRPSIRTVHRSIQQRFQEFLVRIRTIQQYLSPTLAVLFALFLTIAIATFTYVAVNTQYSVVDALYFSVGMITGAGGNESIAEDGTAPIKIFTVIMMLVGAGVVGVCYALLIDFVLGTRFRQLWNNARVPQRHHYIICGLGGVGLQTLHHLRSSGCDIVVIEQDPNNRFLGETRDLKIPVIQGDASVASTLAEANVHEADALLALTSNDVTNLEIALSAKGLDPKLPVIMRSQDPLFAAQSQQVFEFEAVLSPAELAAPSFAAAALGGQVIGNGITASTLWVALATSITPEHPFCGYPVKVVAVQSDFVPLYLQTQYKQLHGWELLEARLNPGDVLYLTMPASKLDRLWRSNSVPLAVPINP